MDPLVKLCLLISPELYLTGLILAVLFIHLFKENAKPGHLIRFSIFALLPIFGLLGMLWPVKSQLAGGLFNINSCSIFLKMVFLGGAIPVLAMSAESLKLFRKRGIDYVLILLIALLGSFFLASSGDLITLFITIEWLTISLYVLTTYLRTDPAALEAGTKYLVVGAFSSAIFLYGISLVYGVIGGVKFDQIKMASAVFESHPLFTVGFVLILAGIGFKISAFPFHLWAPDVYQGSPTPTTAFLSVVSKIAGFAALLKFLFLAVGTSFLNWPLLLALVSALTLLYGNLGALGQTNMKRLFAYSSIGHAGYLLMGVTSGSLRGLEAVFFYFAAYAASNSLAFLVITIVGRELGPEISDYRGLAKKNPVLAGSFFLALLSLAGIPPLAGFFGKFLVIQSVLSSGYVWLALLGAVNVVVSLFYYLSVIKEMYFKSDTSGKEIKIGFLTQSLLFVLILFIVAFGIFQAPLYSVAKTSAFSLL